MPRHCRSLLASPAEWHSAFFLLFHYHAAFPLGNWHLTAMLLQGTWTYHLFLVPQILCFGFGSQPFWLIWPDGAVRDAHIPDLNLLMQVSRAEAAAGPLLSPSKGCQWGWGCPRLSGPTQGQELWRAIKFCCLLTQQIISFSLRFCKSHWPSSKEHLVSQGVFIPGGRNWTTHIWIALSVWKGELLNTNYVMLSEASLSPGSNLFFLSVRVFALIHQHKNVSCLHLPFFLLRKEKCLSRFWNQPTGMRGTSQVFPGSSNISI